MICPNCKEEFGIAYISKDAPHNRKIECPTCHTLWENPELNHCVYLETNGKCFRTRKKCKGELGYELCSDYKAHRICSQSNEKTRKAMAMLLNALDRHIEGIQKSGFKGLRCATDNDYNLYNFGVYNGMYAAKILLEVGLDMLTEGE